jgi:hypothetical protein
MCATDTAKCSGVTPLVDLASMSALSSTSVSALSSTSAYHASAACQVQRRISTC